MPSTRAAGTVGRPWDALCPRCAVQAVHAAQRRRAACRGLHKPWNNLVGRLVAQVRATKVASTGWPTGRRSPTS